MLVFASPYPSASVVNGHVYWRLYVTASSGSSGTVSVALSNLEFRATAGGADQVPVCTADNMGAAGQTLFSTAFSSSAYLAFDATTTGTSWTSATGFPQYIGYQFPSAVAVEQIQLYTDSNATNFLPSAFKIQYSDDGVTWYDRAAYSGQSLTASTGYTFSTASTAPTFSVSPTVSTDTGFFGTGDVATVSYTHNGASTTIAWLRDGVAIGGATSASYTYVSGDVGHTVAAQVTAIALDPTLTTVATSSGNSIVTPTFGTDTRVPAGDMNSGSDSRLTAGDMQSGTDLRVTTTRTA